MSSGGIRKDFECTPAEDRVVLPLDLPFIGGLCVPGEEEIIDAEDDIVNGFGADDLRVGSCSSEDDGGAAKAACPLPGEIQWEHRSVEQVELCFMGRGEDDLHGNRLVGEFCNEGEAEFGCFGLVGPVEMIRGVLRGVSPGVAVMMGDEDRVVPVVVEGLVVCSFVVRSFFSGGDVGIFLVGGGDGLGIVSDPFRALGAEQPDDVTAMGGVRVADHVKVDDRVDVVPILVGISCVAVAAVGADFFS